MTAIAAQIIEFLAEELDRSGRPAAVTADLPLIESGLLDSVTLMRLVTFLEEAFDIDLAADQIVPANFATVDDIAALVATLESSAA